MLVRGVVGGGGGGGVYGGGDGGLLDHARTNIRVELYQQVLV